MSKIFVGDEMGNSWKDCGTRLAGRVANSRLAQL